MRKALRPRLNKFILEAPTKDGKPHVPTVTQTAFLLIPHREAFYGGAAGGGKSDALLMAALQYVDVPGYAGLLLRKSFTDLQLPGALMDRSFAWLADRPDCHWVERDHRWEFESGAVLQFGYLERKRDRYRYQSANFNFIGFDELTQFEIDEYLYVAHRLRRGEGVRIPSRLRAASNPGGLGHEWVRTRFIPKIETLPSGQTIITYPRDENGNRRPFIPAKLSDNPHIDQADYIKSLMMLDPVTRAQMLNGDWSAVAPGSVFKREWLTRNLIDTAPKLVKRAIYFDLAGTEQTEIPPNDPDRTAGVWGGMTADGKLVLEGGVRAAVSPAGAEALVSEVVDKLNVEPPGRYPVSIEQEPGQSGKAQIANYARRVLPGYIVRGDRPTGDKATRAALLASMAERGDVYIVRGPWVGPFIEELIAFTGDEKLDGHDDYVDAASGLTLTLFRPAAAKSHSYIGEAAQLAIRKGDLVLRGERYVDKRPDERMRRLG